MKDFMQNFVKEGHAAPLISWDTPNTLSISCLVNYVIKKDSISVLAIENFMVKPDFVLWEEQLFLHFGNTS
jgi:hypothetical protein